METIYKLISERTKDEFEIKLNRSITEGFKLSGNLQTSTSGGAGIYGITTLYSQLLVKSKVEENNNGVYLDKDKHKNY